MGWDSSYEWRTKKQVEISLIHGYMRSGWTVHAHKSTRDGIWFVVENTKKEMMINFALVNYYQGIYSVKTMSESMGPHYYCCPVKFLDMVEAPSDVHSQAWRKEVMERDAKKNRELAPGMVIKLYNKVYTIHEKRKHSWTCRGDGKLYKLTRAQLAQWQEVTKLEQNLAGMV
jgi:hypothetical protein